MDKNTNEKPRIFLVLKVIGFTLIAIGAILLLAGITKRVPDMGADNWFEMKSSQMGLIFGGVACGMISVPVLILGFRAEIAKVSTKTAKYIQNETKEDLTEIADNTADIVSGAITKTTRAVKEGLTKEDAIFCKHCGKAIDSDSKFCRHCGKEQ